MLPFFRGVETDIFVRISRSSAGFAGGNRRNGGPVRSNPAYDPGITHKVDPDFLEHLRREELDEPELPWGA
jgi:hypothetical protein